MKKCFSDETNTVLVDVEVPEPVETQITLTMPRSYGHILAKFLGDVTGEHPHHEQFYHIYDALDEALGGGH